MMMTSAWPQTGIALALGLALGWLYFGALWLTVQRILGRASASSVTMLLALSYAGRLGLTLLVFYWLATWGFMAFAAGILGFSIIALAQVVSKARA